MHVFQPAISNVCDLFEKIWGDVSIAIALNLQTIDIFIANDAKSSTQNRPNQKKQIRYELSQFEMIKKTIALVVSF